MDITKLRTTGGADGLNCVAELDESLLSRIASGSCDTETAGLPLSGMPLLVKDNIDVRRLHTTAGSLALDDNLAEQDAPVIANLKKNGAVIIGKANMTEFANFTTRGMPGGYSSRGGQVIHAADPTLNPSGSSSGSAVAVAAGLVPAAIGTDTSFSIIACAQRNGICGLKPPVGALSAEGIIPLARTFDSAGPLARTMTDALRVYSCMRDTPLPAKAFTPAEFDTLRLALNTANRDQVSEGQSSFLTAFIERAEQGGASVTEILQEPSDRQLFMMSCEFRPHLEDYLKTAAASRKTLSEIVSCYRAHPDTMMKYGITWLTECLELDTTLPEYQEAVKIREAAIQQVHEELAGYDAVIMTGPTNIMHFCGLPSVCIASSTKGDSGVPRCLIMYGLDELRLYRAALAVEQLLQTRFPL